METVLVIEPNEQQPRNSEGDIIELKDGRLCLIYSRFTVGGSDHAAADLAMRISSDGGRTWSDDSIAIANESGMNVMSVTLLRLLNGDIALFYLQKQAIVDCRPVMRVSSDECETWSDPVLCITDEVGYYVLNNDRVKQLDGGRLIVPVALHNTPEQKIPDWRGLIMCYLSDDGGGTWHRSRDPQMGYAPTGERITVQEPGVLLLKDGRLLMWCRSGGDYQYCSYSEDDGETWSKLKPSTLASPVSPASIKRIPWTGDLMCVWNDHSGLHPFRPVLRSPLCLAVSRDDGLTWTPSIILENDPERCYCYTTITFVGDRVLLAYCAGDKKVGDANRLRIVALSKDWLQEYSRRHP